MSENVKVAKAAGVVGIATLASRIMGYLRDTVMSWAFGTSLAADAFYVAYRIPNLLRELLAEGSMSAAFIPVFTETLTKESRESARQLANAILARFLVILLAATGLGIVLAPYIVKAIAPGWVIDPKNLNSLLLATSLTKMMFPYLLFIGMAALAMGMLNSLRSFLTPALSPVMLNIMTIASVVLSLRLLPNPIYGAAIGVVLGGFFQFLIQMPALKRHDMMVRPRFKPSHPGVKKVARLAGPIFFSSSVNQINIFVGTIFASFLATGSITYLFYGMRFIHFPLGIFGIAIATAVLPSMSTQAARQEMTEFRETLSFGLRLVFFIMFPAMAGLISLRIPIVNLLLQHGQFDRLSTLGTAAALLFYAVGLWSMAGVRIVAQAFYSLQDTKTPVKISIIAVISNMLLSGAFLLWTQLAHGGLALATSLASMLNITLLTVLLRRKIGRIDASRIARSLLKIIPASIAVGAIGWRVAGNPLWEGTGHTLFKAGLLIGTVTGSMLMYTVLMWLMKSEEFAFLWGMVRKKVKR